MDLQANVLNQLSSLAIAPGLGVFVGLREAGDPDAERVCCALILLVAAILYWKLGDLKFLTEELK